MSDSLNPEVAVLNAALELPVGQRAAYLDQACAGQPELRRRAEELLAAHDRAGSFLDRPGPANVSTIKLTPPPEEALGTMIGRYKLLEKVGEGGRKRRGMAAASSWKISKSWEKRAESSAALSTIPPAKWLSSLRFAAR